jgi:hypothetical protein
MNRGDGPRLAFHYLQMHQNLTGSLLDAAQLVSLEIDQAHVFRFHEAFGNQSRSAEGNVIAHANGDVAAIAINVGTLP